MLTLEFDRGTILIRSDELFPETGLPGCVLDPRVGLWRAPARYYRDLVTVLTREKLEFDDRARGYEELEFESQLTREPFPHQQEAVEAWLQGGRRGVVVLPTGAGKTFAAQMIMERIGRSTLVVTPTIDLMRQWYSIIATSYDLEVGLIGGGYYEPKPVTVTTYDSAYIHMERLGNRYGLIIFDECHHLPGPSYLIAADSCIAPFRLGLTATPERDDGEETQLLEAIGPISYRREIKELAGEYLSEYETVRLRVQLSEDERDRYGAERGIYRAFLSENSIDLSAAYGWTRFLMLSSRSEAGRRALLAYRTQKEIAQASGAKIRTLERLLERHRKDRVLIFTSDNKTVYRISRQFLTPAITHQTKVKERHETLQRFNAGEYPFLVTSRVLNEGVDVPAANVGIVLSGSGSVREHVQRLGRILRRAEGKHATLYEVVTEDTAEEYVSSRRRRHSAYR